MKWSTEVYCPTRHNLEDCTSTVWWCLTQNDWHYDIHWHRCQSWWYTWM